MCYEIVWNREVVDEADTKEEAEMLRREMEMAFNGPVSIRHRAEPMFKIREQEYA